MKASRARAFAGLACALTLAACATVDVRTPSSSRYALRLLGSQVIPHHLDFRGMPVGGLSGIDYDPASDRYFLISDDRGRFAPNRFYVARLAVDERGFHDAALESVVTLLAPDGGPYPVSAADSEAIRFDARTASLWWTSEGMRRPAADGRWGPGLIDPFIRRSSLDGRYTGEIPLDPMFRITPDARGPRDNLVFEGLTLGADGRTLWVSMEGPLLQDGPVPTFTDGAWSRFTRYDRTTDGGFGSPEAQFAYRIDPIPSLGAWASSRAQNGVSEILAIDERRLFVLERAFVLGAGWRVRLFEADWSRATDIRSIDSLQSPDVAFEPMTKELVLDFDTLGIRIDNLEGLCFGPTLPNGHRTLVLVSDDNFNALEVTQLIALELVAR